MDVRGGFFVIIRTHPDKGMGCILIQDTLSSRALGLASALPLGRVLVQRYLAYMPYGEGGLKIRDFGKRPL